MMRADRSLFADLFAIDRSRMHLIALALAHLDIDTAYLITPYACELVWQATTWQAVSRADQAWSQALSRSSPEPKLSRSAAFAPLG
jgi:hypothetical protein